MRITSTQRVSIGGLATPDCLLHVHSATAGDVTARTDTMFCVENSDNAYINILTPNDKHGGIYFGDEDNASASFLLYSHLAKTMTIGFEGSARITILEDSTILNNALCMSVNTQMTAGAGGTSGSPTAVDIGRKFSVILTPTAANQYYSLEGAYSGQIVAVVNTTEYFFYLTSLNGGMDGGIPAYDAKMWIKLSSGWTHIS
jgi:hypothetical protein